MFWRKKKPLNLAQINLDAVPYATAEQLLNAVDGKEILCNRLYRASGMDKSTYTAYYQSALHAFAQRVQLIPGSVNHHHAGLGGLLRHTLEVIDIAMQLCETIKLPPRTPLEEQKKKELLWTYGVFVAALLHDYGKKGTMAIIHPINKRNYRITFPRTNYAQQQINNVVGMDIIPNEASEWIQSDPMLVSQLSALLSNHRHEEAELGAIIRKADQISVSRNIGVPETRVNQNSASQQEMIFGAARSLIARAAFVVNRPNGHVFIKHTKAFILTKVFLDWVRAEVQNLYQATLPTDNYLLLNNMIEQNICIAVPKTADANWHIRTLMDNQSVELNCLCFEASRLFYPMPADWKHQIKLVNTQSQKKIHFDDEPTSAPPVQESTPNQQKQETVITSIPPKVAATSSIQSTSMKDEDIFAATEQITSPNQTTEPEQEQAKEESENANYNISLTSPDLGKACIKWVREQIANKEIQLNSGKHYVHIVNEGVLLIAPKVWRQFVEFHELPQKDESGEQTWARVQRQVQRLNLNIKTQDNNKQNAWEFQIRALEHSLKGWLFPLSIFFAEDQKPPINTTLNVKSS